MCIYVCVCTLVSYIKVFVSACLFMCVYVYLLCVHVRDMWCRHRQQDAASRRGHKGTGRILTWRGTLQPTLTSQPTRLSRCSVSSSRWQASFLCTPKASGECVCVCVCVCVLHIYTKIIITKTHNFHLIHPLSTHCPSRQHPHQQPGLHPRHTHARGQKSLRAPRSMTVINIVAACVGRAWPLLRPRQ